jgi:FkbM family methyltransferase
MCSYAQNFEDVTLRRAFRDIDKGFYVDIGSYHPRMHSVTKYFYDRGWSGLNVEPNPALLERFVAERPNDTNIGVAVGGKESEIDLYIIGNTGLTTTIESIASGHAAAGYATTGVVRVKMLMLETLFEKYCRDRTIDFLKIDVEGAESDVIRPCKFENYRPRIILAENSSGYHEDLLSKGYAFCWFDGLNRWFVRQEDDWRCDLVARPPSVWDRISNLTPIE